MKRDWTLIREILIQVEENESVTYPEIEKERINYHLDLLEQAGFLRKFALTWQGHDAVALMRDEETFLDAQEMGRQRGFDSLPWDCLKTILERSLNPFLVFEKVESPQAKRVGHEANNDGGHTIRLEIPNLPNHSTGRVVTNV